jgi:hypothetical protein
MTVDMKNRSALLIIKITRIPSLTARFSVSTSSLSRLPTRSGNDTDSENDSKSDDDSILFIDSTLDSGEGEMTPPSIA